MTDNTKKPLACLHDDLVRTITQIPGVSRLVPSYRELLSRTAQRMLGGDGREASGVDIVVRPRAGTTVYVDLFAAAGFETGALVDELCDEILQLLHSQRSGEQEGGPLLDGGQVSLKVRVLGVE